MSVNFCFPVMSTLKPSCKLALKNAEAVRYAEAVTSGALKPLGTAEAVWKVFAVSVVLSVIGIDQFSPNSTVDGAGAEDGAPIVDGASCPLTCEASLVQAISTEKSQ